MDIATLGLAIDSRQAKAAATDLNQLSHAGAAAEKSTIAMSKAFGAFSGILAGVSIGAIASKIVATEREFGKLSAQLKTATGSTAAATAKFADLEKTATKLPESLADTVGAFVKLKNLGLDPSERAIVSYSNTASAMGKSLNQMIEAVADASTGEFERLKEFGIRSKKEGDNVTFTFRGVETTVKASAENIQQYLLRLGEMEFAGAAAERMNTLDGAISNLGDAWDGLFRRVSGAGVGDVMTQSVKEMADALSDPRTVEAAQALGAGVVSALNGIATAATETVGSIKYLAESLAASFNGPAIGDIVRIEERLVNLKAARGRGIFSRLVDGYTDEELDAEIARLEKMLAMSRRPAPQIPAPTAPASSAAGPRAPAFSGGASSKPSKADTKFLDEVQNFDLAKFTEANSAAAVMDTEVLSKMAAANDEYIGAMEERLNMAGVHAEGFWERYLTAAESSLTNFDELSASAVETFSRGFGSAFESMIFDAESAGDAFNGLMQDMARSTVNTLGQMAAQWLAYQAVRLIVGETEDKIGAKHMFANAQAMALQSGIAAFAATAAIPYVGPALAPGALKAALAVTEPMALAIGAITGMAHDGMSNIPREGTWLLDGGERVVAPQQNRDLTRYLERQNNSSPQAGSEAHVSLQINAVDSRSIDRLFERRGRALAKVLRQQARNYARV